MHGARGEEQDWQFNFVLEKFSSEHRLLRRNGFNHVVQGESILDEWFKVFFVCNDKKHARLGIIVGKKILFAATDRNHIKRVIRETFRHHSINLCKFDIVVLVRRSNTKKNDAQIRNLKMLFTRLEKRCAER